MQGNPTDFEAIGSRLGFRVIEQDSRELKAVWQGARFPAFLCLGIAVSLLAISVPIVQAIQLRGFDGPASSLWYFPVMNLILFGIALYLVALRRTVWFDHERRRAIFAKRTLIGNVVLTVPYEEILRIELGVDQVYSGFAIAGSSAAEKHPVPSLRLVTGPERTVLIDRGSRRRLEDLGRKISAPLQKPLTVLPANPAGSNA